MRGVNSVTILGTLGADPDVKYAANGNAIANLSIATSEEWVDKNSGQKQSKTEWHRVVLFSKVAEVAAQYLKKGSQVYIRGKLTTRKWQDKNSGQDRYTTEIVVDFNGEMQMLGGRSKGDENEFSQQQDQSFSPRNPAQAPAPMGALAPANQGFDTDDLDMSVPF